MLVPWSPLGAGFLTGTIERLSNGDFRRNNPKFTGDNLRANLDRFAPLRELAKTLSLTPAQLALAWLLHQGDDMVPIPGTRKIARIDENAKSASVVLDKYTLRRIDEIMLIGAAVGNNLV
jgi:aryl-alcohol dehydrogenase-like predicted oxidoreductase